MGILYIKPAARHLLIGKQEITGIVQKWTDSLTYLEANCSSAVWDQSSHFQLFCIRKYRTLRLRSNLFRKIHPYVVIHLAMPTTRQCWSSIPFCFQCHSYHHFLQVLNHSLPFLSHQQWSWIIPRRQLIVLDFLPPCILVIIVMRSLAALHLDHLKFRLPYTKESIWHFYSGQTSTFSHDLLLSSELFFTRRDQMLLSSPHTLCNLPHGSAQSAFHSRTSACC